MAVAEQIEATTEAPVYEPASVPAAIPFPAFSCDLKPLVAALARVAGPVKPRPTLPITAGLLLQADADGTLTISGTNFDQWHQVFLPIAVTQPGAIAVNAAAFVKLVTMLERESATFRGEKNKLGNPSLAITCGRQTARVDQCWPAEEFPNAPKLKGDSDANHAAFDAQAVARAVERVKRCVADDDTRPQLAGILVRLRDTGLTLVGCDSFRLAVATVETTVDPNFGEREVDLIVPAAALLNLAKYAMAKFAPGQVVVIRWDANQVRFDLGNLRIWSRIIEGRYVEYQRVVDQTRKHDIQVVVKRADFLRLIQGAMPIAKEGKNACRVTAKGEAVTLSAVAAAVGEISASCDAALVGEGELALDCTYLADAVAAIDTDHLLLTFTRGQTLPAMLVPVGVQDQRQVIMPMHLKR